MLLMDVYYVIQCLVTMHIWYLEYLWLFQIAARGNRLYVEVYKLDNHVRIWKHKYVHQIKCIFDSFPVNWILSVFYGFHKNLFRLEKLL